MYIRLCLYIFIIFLLIYIYQFLRNQNRICLIESSLTFFSPLHLVQLHLLTGNCLQKPPNRHFSPGFPVQSGCTLHFRGRRAVCRDNAHGTSFQDGGRGPHAEALLSAPHFRMTAEGRMQKHCSRHLTSRWRHSAPHFRMAAEGCMQKHCSRHLTSGWRQRAVCRSTALGTSLLMVTLGQVQKH